MRLLYIAHRIPYPPNKGDKIRSYNELAFLCRHFEVDLVFFFDGPEKREHLDHLQAMCKTVSGFRRGPWHQLTRLVAGAARGAPLSVSLYHHGGMAERIRELIAGHDYSRIFIFSGQMVQYIPAELLPRTVIDFCDVDSHKWDNYAERLPIHRAWFYRLEARRLLAFERAASEKSRASLFVTPAELRLYQGLGGRGRLAVLGNGVDTAYFRPREEPWQEGRILFTGAMDYFPNEEGVAWFAREVFVPLRARFPGVRFVIAGSNPSLRVRRLAQIEGVEVTGYVPDMRAEQARAHIVVVPLRIARGMQNKVLEAMACGKAVVASRKALGGIDAEEGRDLCIADTPEAFLASLEKLLRDPGLVDAMGRAAREHILRNFNWDSNLNLGLLPLFEGPGKSQVGLPAIPTGQ